MITHEKVKRKHDTLCNIVNTILLSQGLPSRLSVQYSKGELDVYCNGVYYEIKCNFNHKSYKKGKDQIYRAMKHCVYPDVNEGYIVSYDGVTKIE